MATERAGPAWSGPFALPGPAAGVDGVRRSDLYGGNGSKARIPRAQEFPPMQALLVLLTLIMAGLLVWSAFMES
jgi:hypothetical protein